MNTLTLIALVFATVSILLSVILSIFFVRTIKKLKNSDKELAKTMIMNFDDYEKIFKEHKTTQAEIKRDNQAIMNELKRVQTVVSTLNNGFTIPSFHNVEQ